jgi:choline-sulfatase
MRHHRGVMAFCARIVVLAALLSAATGTIRAATPPNVIVISVDTLRADHLPAYGYKVIRTPHLDRFRADAILYEQAWSPYPLTAPAHGSIFTGRLPPDHGIRDNSGFTLDTRVPTMAGALAARGYTTGAVVSSAILRSETGLARGFAFYDDHFGNGERRRTGDRSVAAAVSWLEANKRRPFFLFLHLYEPHAPRQRLEGVADSYDGEIVRADLFLGRLFDYLRREKLYDGALIVFLSDHGEGLGDHGERQHGVLLYRETLQVPLMVKLPGLRLAGRSVAADAQLIDVLPTVLEQTGGLPRTTLPGRSLVTLATAPAAPRPAFAETLYPRLQLGWSELHSVIRGGMHLIDGPHVELYDLNRDPQERTNLAAEQRRVTAALRAELRQVSVPAAVPTAPTDSEGLAALGYLSGGSGKPGAAGLPDPRERVIIVQPMIELMTALRRKQYAAALTMADRLLAQHPTFGDVWEKKAMALFALGREAEGKAALRRAISNAPQ